MNTKISRTLATIVLSLVWMESALAIKIVHTAVNPANGHTYHLLSADDGSGLTWAASEAYAVSLGGHLTTINDNAENGWVFDTFADYGGVSRTLWTGYRRLSERRFVLLDERRDTRI
jgi:hypothetical protein